MPQEADLQEVHLRMAINIDLRITITTQLNTKCEIHVMKSHDYI